MWHRFSESARRAISAAQEEAQRLGHGLVSTEHLLMGILRVADPAVVSLLGEFRIPVEKLNAELNREVFAGDAPMTIQDMTLTPHAKRVIDWTLKEAKQLGDKEMTNEHFVLGILSEQESFAAQLLLRLGMDADRARRKVFALHGGKAEEYRNRVPAEPPPTEA